LFLLAILTVVGVRSIISRFFVWRGFDPERVREAA
jgi:hypothetical protein